MRVVPILALALLFSCQQKEEKQTQRPNIIFLLADDLGYGDVGIYDQKLIKTPNIDQLAQEGLLFTDFYAGAPVCGPSRSVLITGQHTGHTTLRGNMASVGGKPGLKRQDTVYRANLTQEDFTIGNLLQDAGYYTGMIGKWHLGGFDTLATPLHLGFDEFSGWLINYPETYASTYWPDKRYRNGRIHDISENQDGKKGYYHTSICTDEATDFLNARRDSEEPFMLMVNYNNPHAPLDAPDLSIYEQEDWPENMKIYASMIHYLDQSVGRIRDHLVKNGLAENTILFFCSDNGPRSNYSGELTEVADFFDSNGQLRGYKRDMYEGGIRTPMIAWGPGMVPKGKVSNVPGYFPDMMPTFAAMAASQKEFNTDGTNLYPVILGEQYEAAPRTLYWEFHENGFEQAVRFQNWKLIKRGDQVELYDLPKDISETNEVSQSHPDVVERILSYLDTCRTESSFWPTK